MVFPTAAGCLERFQMRCQINLDAPGECDWLTIFQSQVVLQQCERLIWIDDATL